MSASSQFPGPDNRSQIRRPVQWGVPQPPQDNDRSFDRPAAPGGGASVNDLPLVVCWFETGMPRGPALGDSELTTWGAFTEALSSPRREGEKDGCGFIPARFKPEPDGKHVRRLGRNLLARTAVALDCETSKETGEVPPSPDDTEARLRNAGWAGALYTSHNHTPAAPRYRIVLPLAEEIGPELPAVEVVADRLGLWGVVDRSKTGAASLFYAPSSAPGELDRHRTTIIDGAPIGAVWVREAAGKLLAERRAEEERIAAEARAEAEKRRQAKIAAGFDPDDSLIEKIRAHLDLRDILLSHGYEQLGSKFRHPNSSSGMYGADIKLLSGVERLFSHNATDPLHAANLPAWCGGTTAIDSVDVVAILDYGGDRTKALRELGERFGIIKPKNREQVGQGNGKGPPPPGESDKPEEPSPSVPPGARITVKAGLRHIAADEGLAAMDAAGIAFYQRDGALVRVCRIKAKASDKTTILVPGIVSVRLPLLRRALGQAAYWDHYDKRADKLVRFDPPKEVAEQIAEMIDEWPFPPLAGIIGCPTLRPDGSLLDRPGYDHATGLVLENSLRMPAIPARPAKEDAERALVVLNELLGEFLFSEDKGGQAAARSQLITPVLRGAMAAAPMHLTTAPEAGSGKSYMADIASMIATGERCPVMAMSKNPEESEKRLLGAALEGMPIISLDNTNRQLEGEFLSQVTERPLLALRGLGAHKIHRVNNSFTVLANGNNAGVADDLVRRTLTIGLDTNREDPENRTFKTDPLAMIRANRGKYVAACLTIARAYISEGKPKRLPPIASYEAWSDLVRSPLVWLGHTDPVETIATARATDPTRSARRMVFEAWKAALGTDTGYVVSEVTKKAETHAALRAALLTIAKNKKDPEQIDPQLVGTWLKKNENTVAGRRKLIVDRGDKSRPRWQLVELG